MYGCAINLSFLNAGQDGLLWRLFGRRHDWISWISAQA
jgi:hypothetical protein